jgi:predicted MFS family arabinose efflux permease
MAHAILPIMLSNHFTLTKRHVGLLLLLIGIGGFVGILSIDLLDVGREGGIGPAQQIALGGMLFLAVVGLTLLPLGKAPA